MSEDDESRWDLCPVCDGQGFDIVGEKCMWCDGQGMVTEDDSIDYEEDEDWYDLDGLWIDDTDEEADAPDT